MKARESKDISSATPKIQCQVSEQRRERSPFPNHHPARIEGSSWNNWFWQECVKSFAFCAEVGRKGSLLGNWKQQQQQIRQKWKLLIEILFGVNMRSMSTCLLVLQFLNISWKARRLFLWRRLIQESLGLFSQRINLAESSIYHRRRSNSQLACFHKLMAEKAENMYEWPDSEGKQVLCHSAHAKRVTSMTLDHTARTYPCRHSGQ